MQLLRDNLTLWQAESGILVFAAIKRVEFCYRCVKSLFGKFTRFVLTRQDFVVENRKVEGESQFNWVGCFEGFRSGPSLFVRRFGFSCGRIISTTTSGLYFSKVSQVVSFHLVVEHLSLVSDFISSEQSA